MSLSIIIGGFTLHAVSYLSIWDATCLSIMQNSNIQEQKEEKHLNEIVAFATEV